ncbi:MAG: coenzyme F420-0:L-glutamate ligase [Patescibacteria group bacterium]
MRVTPYKTPIVQVGDDLFEVLKKHLPKIQENDVVVITSKIIGLCENAVVSIKDLSSKAEKHAVVQQESEYYIDPHSSKYDLMLTIKHQVLAVNAGIDESNVDGYYVLWPQDPQKSVNAIWNWLKETYGLKQVGVILSDSRTIPLKWGVIGTALSHCGFLALNDMRGKPDLFGREMKMTQINVADALAVAAVYEMGETNESTPLAVISDVSGVAFQDHEPTKQELADLVIELEDDVYAPILQKADWKKGGAA